MKKTILRTQEDFDNEFHKDEEPECKTFTWGDLRKLINNMPKEILSRGVQVVDDGGCDVYPTEMCYNKRTKEYYIREKR